MGVHSRKRPPLSFGLILSGQGHNGTQSAVDTPDDKKLSDKSIEQKGIPLRVSHESVYAGLTFGSSELYQTTSILCLVDVSAFC